MLDNEVEVGKIGGGVIDVVHVKGIAVEGIDRWAFVHMNIFYTKLLR